MSKETMPMKSVRGPLSEKERAALKAAESTFGPSPVLALDDALRAALERAEKAEAVLTAYGFSGVGSRIEELLAERDAALAKLKTATDALRDERNHWHIEKVVPTSETCTACEALAAIRSEHLPLRKETGACAMCGALAEEQVVPPKTDPGQYLDRSMVSIHGSDGCSNCETGRITIYAASRWCLECQAKSPTRSGA